MKYLLKQNKEDKGILCDKVTIDGFEYYVSDEKINSSNYEDFNFWFYNPYIKELQINCNPNSCHKVIATTNPNIDVPKVVREVDIIADSYYPKYSHTTDLTAYQSLMRCGFEKGYSKSQETHSFSEENMIKFAEWCRNSAVREFAYGIGETNNWELKSEQKIVTTKELLQLWKEQQPKIVYYD